MAARTYRSADARSTPPTTTTTTSKVPVSLAKRLLFPHLPPGADLPSLLVADDTELNAELYDLIALALRGFVAPWWTKITRHDKEFLPEITRVIAVFLRSVEARLAAADLPSFVCRDLPAIVSQHYADYRHACTKVGTSYATGGAATLPQIFHQLQPHMAVSPEGHWNETYVRQAVEHAMKSCLPPADWEAETERTIVREILAKVILGSVFSRLAQPWYLHKLILDLLGPPPGDPFKPLDPPSRPPSRGRLTFHSLVVFFLSAVQTLSGLCLVAIALGQKTLSTIRAINASSPPLTTVPHLARFSIDMIAEILTMRSRASSAAVLSLLELCAGFSRPFTDRALPYVLYTQVINVARLTKVLVQGKSSLFPDGYPAESPPDPTPEEQIVLRERLEARLMTLLPSMPAALLLGHDAVTRGKTVSNAIAPLSSSECNVHLLILLFDAVLLALFPELGILSGGMADYTGEEIDDPLLIGYPSVETF